MKSVRGNSLRYITACMLGIGLFSLFFLSPAAFAQSDPAPASTNAITKDDRKACDAYFLTLPAWYNGLTKPVADKSCEIVSPTDVGGLTPFVTIIGLNVVEIILRLSGYASAAFIMYGGFKYITSAGSPDGMVGARKTIMNAVIGLIISLAAVAIVNTIAKGI